MKWAIDDEFVAIYGIKLLLRGLDCVFGWIHVRHSAGASVLFGLDAVNWGVKI